jgi:hypothetical protein
MVKLTPIHPVRSAVLVVALCLFGVGCSNSTKEGDAKKGEGSSGAASMTVSEFRKAVVGKSFKKDEFYEKFGKPSQTTDSGSDTHLTYACKDGTAVVKTPKGPFQHQDRIAPFGVDQR